MAQTNQNNFSEFKPIAINEGMPDRVFMDDEKVNICMALNGTVKMMCGIPETNPLFPDSERYVLGTDHGNKIYLWSGDDTVFTGRGNDEIWVGMGHNTMTTDSGNDIVHIEAHEWKHSGGVLPFSAMRM